MVPVACGNAQTLTLTDGVPFALELQQKCGGQKRCEIVFPPVAPGHRLIIKRIGVAVEIVAGRSLQAVFSAPPLPPLEGTRSDLSVAVAGKDALIVGEGPVRYSFGGGTAYRVTLSTDGFFSTIAPTVGVSVSGHLTDCIAGACPTDVAD